MQPQAGYAPTILPNEYSPALLARRDAWAKAQGIEPDEMLVFRTIGTGNTAKLMIKSAARGHENRNFEPIKPVPESHMIPMQESIRDSGARGGFVRLVHYAGGYYPGADPTPVIFKGPEETVITVIPEENEHLYNFLTLSPRLKGGISANPNGVGTLYTLLRPEAEVDADFQNEAALARVVLAINDASVETLRYLAPKLFISNSSFEQRLRKNFSDFAKLNAANVAKVQAMFDADETLMYGQMEQAVAANLVAVDPNRQMWVLANNQQPITPASMGRNAIDQLVEYLALEAGQVTYKQILGLLGDPEVAATVGATPTPKNRGGRPPRQNS